MSLSLSLKAKTRLIQAWRAGVACVGGERAVRAAIGGERDGRAITHLLAVGKAASAMCAGALEHLAADGVALVVTKHRHCDAAVAAHPQVTVIESGHPTPDANSLRAGREMAAMVRAAPSSAELVMLLSGGASALAEDLADAIGLDDLRRLTEQLLAGGYDIERINAARTRLSRIKGGRLLGGFRGRSVRVYAISDVRGDRIEVIGGGIGALGRVESLADSLPPEMDDLLARLGEGDSSHGDSESRNDDSSHGDNELRNDDSLRNNVSFRANDSPHNDPSHSTNASDSIDYRAHIIASNRVARDGAATFLRDAGLNVVVNEESLHCDLHAAAQRIAADVLAGPPGAYVWGGEPTVVLPRKPGVGGRNQSLALAFAKAIRGRRDLCALVAGTDGTDGPTAVAGALVDGDTFDAASGAARALQKADAGTYLARIAALFKPGPTGTNVMDLAIAIKHGRA
ncbi:MAG: DUF4147 domain-containing protein [bacterium]